MAKVYITHDDGRFDLGDAKRFGDLVTVTSRDFYPDNVDAQIPKVWKRAKGILQDFKPATDYLCLVGSPIIISLCSVVLGQLFPTRKIMVLRFDRHEQAYYAVQF